MLKQILRTRIIMLFLKVNINENTLRYDARALY